jgi:transposase, IS5 family
MTRVVQSKQLTLGEYSIEHIQFDPKSRDDVPQILQGLQYLYVNEDLRKLLFSNLEKNDS